MEWGALKPSAVGLASSKYTSFLILLVFYSLHLNIHLARERDISCLTYLLDAVYRLNTFPIIHVGFIHALLNALALTPLLERFEREHGTLTTIALFFGRAYLPLLSVSICLFFSETLSHEFQRIALSTLPGGLYILVERVILRGDTAVLGARYVQIIYNPALRV